MAVATATHSGFVCLSGQAHIRFHNGFAHPSLERCFIPHFRQDLRIEHALSTGTSGVAFLWLYRRDRDLCFPALPVAGDPQFCRTGGDRVDRRHIRAGGDGQGVRGMVPSSKHM